MGVVPLSRYLKGVDLMLLGVIQYVYTKGGRAKVHAMRAKGNGMTHLRTYSKRPLFARIF